MVIFTYRFWIFTHIAGMVGPPALLEPADEPGAQWIDDYYSVFRIDERTFAIGETRYWQLNFNYLILGDERAVLLDAGPGLRDIRPVVKSLTPLPFTFIPSHLHYDHVGNGINFESVGMIDIAYLKERARNGELAVLFEEHLGVAERFDEPTLKITRWLKPGSEIDLGGRKLRVVYTPGHTTDGISLVDEKAGFAFTGDFFVSGPLAEFLPNGGMGDYLQGVDALLSYVSTDARLFGAHRNLTVSSTQTGIPETSGKDLEETRAALLKIRDRELEGRGLYPVVYPINDVIELWANPRWMQQWQPNNPVAN